MANLIVTGGAHVLSNNYKNVDFFKIPELYQIQSSSYNHEDSIYQDKKLPRIINQNISLKKQANQQQVSLLE